MIIQLHENISSEQIRNIRSSLQDMSYKASLVKTQKAIYIVAIGKDDVDIRKPGRMPGVKDIHRVNDGVKLVSRKWKTDYTQINLGDGVNISNGNFTIMSGPCSIEGEEQIIKTVEHLKRNNIRIMRGGVFKPRSSPYSFRGLGINGLKIFSKYCKAAGIKIISEVMQESQIEDMYEYVDIFQVGARNSQNFTLLDALGKVDKPIMIKRGLAGTIDELLFSAEYVFSGGNEQILLCERGIRSYEKSYRNVLDINAVPYLKDKTHLPVIVDPSHAVGIRKYIEPLSLAAVMAGADGIITEVHETPEKAFSDGEQNLNFPEAEALYKKVFKAFELIRSF